jgi:hypothetical protein
LESGKLLRRTTRAYGWALFHNDTAPIEKKQRKIEEYRESDRKYRRGKRKNENAKCYIV